MIRIVLFFVGLIFFIGCKEDEQIVNVPKPDTLFVPEPNLDFESWSPYISDNKDTLWYDPSGGFWATTNRLRLLGEEGPVTTNPVHDSHSGNTAALLETKKFSAFIITGLLMAGQFDPKKYPNHPNYTNEGQPYFKKLERFRGYYKYFGVDGDSGNIYIALTKYDKVKKTRDTIAEGILPLLNVAEYTLFDVVLNYRLYDVEPDSIRLAILSSKSGRDFSSTSSARVGSKLYIDDLEFVLPGGIIRKFKEEFSR